MNAKYRLFDFLEKEGYDIKYAINNVGPDKWTAVKVEQAGDDTETLVVTIERD